VLGELSFPGDDDAAAGPVTANDLSAFWKTSSRQKSKVSKAADRRFMQLALTLGRRGQGRTWPQSAVGAVVVKDRCHRRPAAGPSPAAVPHAEPEALRAGPARAARGRHASM